MELVTPSEATDTAAEEAGGIGELLETRGEVSLRPAPPATGGGGAGLMVMERYFDLGLDVAGGGGGGLRICRLGGFAGAKQTGNTWHYERP